MQPSLGVPGGVPGLCAPTALPLVKTGEEAAACPPTAVDTAVSLPLTRAGESVPSPLGKAAWCSPPPGGRGSTVCARSAVALVPRSSAKELARPSRPSPHALVTSAACPF